LIFPEVLTIFRMLWETKVVPAYFSGNIEGWLSLSISQMRLHNPIFDKSRTSQEEGLAPALGVHRAGASPSSCLVLSSYFFGG
jgi:hypothetical protein